MQDLLKDPIFFRGIQLIIIVLGSILFGYWGYRLFIYGINTGLGRLQTESKIFKIIFSGSGPGLFFMAFGATALIIALFTGKAEIVDMNTNTKRQLASEDHQKTSFPAFSLRSTPQINLSTEEAKSIILENGFYDSEWNKEAHGIPKELERKGELVVDNATGLIWQKAGSDSVIAYEKAKLYVEKLNREKFAGFSDWRLPTLEEAMSLVEPKRENADLYIASEFDRKQRSIATSDKQSDKSIWVVNFAIGKVSTADTNKAVYARAVRKSD